jgi:hypothetical protein
VLPQKISGIHRSVAAKRALDVLSEFTMQGSGGNSMRVICWLLVFFSMLCVGAAQERNVLDPRVYKDPASGALLYLETDGRHVAAISVDGKLLWIRDPFKDAHMPFYRTKTPQIVYIGQIPKEDTVSLPHDKFVSIRFNSTQFGYLSISNGEFRFEGQD